MNGKEVRVWVDRWLPSIPSGRPSPLGTVQVSRNLRVNSLICNESGDWEVDFLKPFVVEEEIKAILEIPLGDPTLKDRLVWHFEKNGAYSVKSGYHWALSRTHIHRNLNPHRSDMIPTQLWKCMWSLEVPPKIRVFMWKSLHAAVATMANLFFRRSSLSPMCPLCNSAEESTEHLFLQCPWVEAMWNGGSMTRGIGRVGIFYWQQPIYPGQVIADVHHSVGMFLEANRVPSSRPQINDLDWGNDVSWSPLGSGFIKINVDASCVWASWVWWLGMIMAGLWLHAERISVLRVWQWLKLRQFCMADLNSMGSWDAFPLLAKCTSLGKAFQDCRWSWVPRSANKAADSLASRHCREACRFGARSDTFSI
ncbi:hypothetical protein TB2_025760 [Malus domestica]